jgi:hypothetical protein
MESIADHPNTSQPNIFRRRWIAGLISVCPPKAKVTHSNRVGCAIFLLFPARCMRPTRNCNYVFMRASKLRKSSRLQWNPAANCQSHIGHAARRSTGFCFIHSASRGAPIRDDRTETSANAVCRQSIQLHADALGAVEQPSQVKAGQGIVGITPDKRGESRHRGRVAGLELCKRRCIIGH